jgi:acyl-CoA synthetase (AMP-forming)/AMP-acid ligase II
MKSNHIGRTIRNWSARKPNATALSNGLQALTWQALESEQLLAQRWSGALAEERVLVGVVGDNSMEYAALALALLGSGVAVALFDARDDNKRLSQQLDLARPHYCYTLGSDSCIADCSEVLRSCGYDRCAFVPPHRAVWQRKALWGDVEIPNEVALIQFTSGSVMSRAVLLSYECLWRRTDNWCTLLGHNESSRFVCGLPLAHAAAMDIHLLPSLHVGACTFLLPGRLLDPLWIARTVERARATFVSNVPATYQLILDHCKTADLSSLRYALVHSSPLRSELAMAFVDAFGIGIANQYGSTEIGGTHANLWSTRSKPTSIGRACSGVSCDWNSTTGDCSVEQPGELIVKSSLMAYGILDGSGLCTLSPEVPYHTGDVGWIDEDGDAYISGRTDDLLSLQGYKIRAQEIERVALSVTGVRGCCAVVVHHRGHDRLALMIESDQVDIVTRVHEALRSLPPYAIPSTVLRTAQLPRSQLGKVRRQDVRDVIRSSFGESNY